jgi:hypothetical protein
MQYGEHFPQSSVHPESIDISRIHPAIAGRMEALVGARDLLAVLRRSLESPVIVPVVVPESTFTPSSQPSPVFVEPIRSIAEIDTAALTEIDFLQGARYNVKDALDFPTEPTAQMTGYTDINFVVAA